MRLNRGTIALLLGSVIIVAAVLILSNTPVDAPTEGTTTPTAEPGPLFADLDMTTLTRLEIVEPSSGARTVLVRTTADEASTVEVEQIVTQEVVTTDDVTAETVAASEVAVVTEAAEATDEVISTEEITVTEDTEAVEVTEEAAVTSAATDETSATEAIIETTEATNDTAATLDPLITPTVTLAPDASVWAISEATTLSNMGIDFTQAENAVAVFSALQSVTSFSDATLTSFGLDAPRFTLTGTDSNSETYRINIGVRNPTQPRYYATINGDTTTVYQIPSDQVESLTNLVANPPYLPTPLPTLPPTPTANPLSEVQQTQTAAIELTEFAATLAVQTFSAPFVMPEVTPAAP